MVIRSARTSAWSTPSTRRAGRRHARCGARHGRRRVRFRQGRAERRRGGAARRGDQSSHLIASVVSVGRDDGLGARAERVARAHPTTSLGPDATPEERGAALEQVLLLAEALVRPVGKRKSQALSIHEVVRRGGA